MKKRAVAAILVLCFCLLLTPAGSRADRENNRGIPRYTVLVLDVSGPQVFEEPPNYLNLWGASYTSDSSIEVVKSAARQFLEDARRAVGENYIAIVAYAEEAWVLSPFTQERLTGQIA